MEKNISLPTDIAIKNVGNDVISFRYFGVNFAQKLAVNEEVIISGASSEATAFYLAQADENKALQVLVNATDDTEGDTTEKDNTPVEEPVVDEPTEPTEPTVEEPVNNNENPTNEENLFGENN